MFTITAHGINAVTRSPALSYAQQRLLTEPAPIRVCGAPTGSGKTHAFQVAAQHMRQVVLFIVPTLALARDIQQGLIRARIPCGRWDGVQMLDALSAGGRGYGWQERLDDLRSLRNTGGMIVATLESLANLVMGKAILRGVNLRVNDVIQYVDHLVFDESHTLNDQAFGFLHFWVTLVAYRHHAGLDGLRMSLLSATPSRLLDPLFDGGYLPPGSVICFDEQLAEPPCDRWLHGDVAVMLSTGLIDTVEQEAPTIIAGGRRLLIVYSSLMALSRDETALANLFDRCGLSRDAVNLIDGMDRQAEQGLGGSGFDTMLTPLPRHRVIIGTSAVEMGVNLGVEAMISDAGFDARACLQRIGRVARGESSGVIFLCYSGDEPPRHYQQLARFKGRVTVETLRQTLEDDEEHLNRARRAQALGSAYWSMLSRRQPALMRELRTMHGELATDKPIPGGRLDRLHVLAREIRGRGRHAYQRWLEQIDDSLADIRGFNPSRRLRFKGMASDRCIEYDDDWAETYLRPAHRIDDDGVHVYDDYRVNCLREQPERFEISILTPYGNCPATIRSLDDARKVQLAFLKRRALRDTTGHTEALAFVRATGLVIRE